MTRCEPAIAAMAPCPPEWWCSPFQHRGLPRAPSKGIAALPDAASVALLTVWRCPPFPASRLAALPRAAPVALPAEVAVPAIPRIVASRHYLTLPLRPCPPKWRCPPFRHRGIAALPRAAPAALPAEVALPAIPGIAAPQHYLTLPLWRSPPEWRCPPFPASRHRGTSWRSQCGVTDRVALPAIPGIAASRHYLTQPVWRC
jgi:hypothetical protein